MHHWWRFATLKIQKKAKRLGSWNACSNHRNECQKEEFSVFSVPKKSEIHKWNPEWPNFAIIFRNRISRWQICSQKQFRKLFSRHRWYQSGSKYCFFSRVWRAWFRAKSTTLNLQLVLFFWTKKIPFFGRLMKPPDKHHQRRSLRGKFFFLQRNMPLGSWDHLEQTTRVTSRNSHKHGPFSLFFSSSLGGSLFKLNLHALTKLNCYSMIVFFHQPQGQGNSQASVTLSFVFLVPQRGPLRILRNGLKFWRVKWGPRQSPIDFRPFTGIISAHCYNDRMGPHCWIFQSFSNSKYIYGCFLKGWVFPTTMGFPAENDQHLGWRLGKTHHFKETTISVTINKRFRNI